MNDSYAEVLVKCSKKPLHTVIQVVVLALSVIFLVVGFFGRMLILFIPGAFLLLVSNFLLPMLNAVEYEYLYVAGEFTIDKIMGKSKRKNCVTVEMDKIEVIVPKGSLRLEEFNRLNCVEADYTSGKEGVSEYVCIYHEEKRVCRIFFEPDEKMVELMRLTAPRKVSIS